MVLLVPHAFITHSLILSFPHSLSNMSIIDRIEIHEFTYETPNLGPDSSGFNFVYQPGGKFAMTKFALVVRTADGGRGEYVAQWGGTKIALAQVMTLVPQLIGKDASQREYIYDICKRALRQFDHMGYGTIDILLWDWAGKSIKQPIYKMLGGWRANCRLTPALTMAIATADCLHRKPT